MITSSNDWGGKAEGRKVALATGGTKGIDRGDAMMLLKKGYYVIVTYAHDKESAEAFANKALMFQSLLMFVKLTKQTGCRPMPL